MHDMEKRGLPNGFQRKIFRIIALENCPTAHLRERPMTVSESYPAIHLGGLSNRFYRNSILCLQKQKPFVLKTMFSHTWLRHA